MSKPRTPVIVTQGFHFTTAPSQDVVFLALQGQNTQTPGTVEETVYALNSTEICLKMAANLLLFSLHRPDANEFSDVVRSIRDTISDFRGW